LACFHLRTSGQTIFVIITCWYQRPTDLKPKDNLRNSLHYCSLLQIHHQLPLSRQRLLLSQQNREFERYHQGQYIEYASIIMKGFSTEILITADLWKAWYFLWSCIVFCPQSITVCLKIWLTQY